MNHTLQSNHCYGNSIQFNRRSGQTLNMYKKPNHFKSSETWRGFKKHNTPDWKSRKNETDRQLLSMLPSEDENESAPQSPRSLIRQLAVDINAKSKNIGLDSSPEEKSSSEPLSDPSLEWDQGNLAMKTDVNSTRGEREVDSIELKNMSMESVGTLLEEIAEEVEHDESDKLLTQNTSSANGSSDDNSLVSGTQELAKKYSRDFSKHLYLTCAQDDVDNPAPYSTGNLDDIPENANTDYISAINDNSPSRFFDDVDNSPRRLYEDVDRIGYTEFDTMGNIPRRSPFFSSPTPSSLHKSPVQSIPTSPIESTHGSVRSGFSELPFRDGLADSLRLSEPSSPYGSPKGMAPGFSSSENRRDNRENSTGSFKHSGRLLLHEKPDSPKNKFADMCSDFRTPCSPGGSLKDGHRSREGRTRRGPFRRALTELNSPSDSCSSLNEKPLASPRRRKVSAVIQPPTIFAPLVTNVNNPYKDFVPPVRESAITCDCESADHIPGINCNSFLERKSDQSASDNTEGNSEDQSEDFYENFESLITENQLQCPNDMSKGNLLEEIDGYSSRLTQTSFESNEQRSDPLQEIDDSPIECSSVKELTDCFEPPFSTYSSLYRRPSISGAYSTHCIEMEEIPESDELGQLFRPMRTSFSEPHLSLRHPLLHASNGRTDSGQLRNGDVDSSASEDTTTRNLEDIFQDVCSTKEAIEKLESILKSPEPEILSDLADTKQTVQKLDKKVLNLNREVASLSTDVKMVLELLKGLKNGQVVA